MTNGDIAGPMHPTIWQLILWGTVSFFATAIGDCCSSSILDIVNQFRFVKQVIFNQHVFFLRWQSNCLALHSIHTNKKNFYLLSMKQWNQPSLIQGDIEHTYDDQEIGLHDTEELIILYRRRRDSFHKTVWKWALILNMWPNLGKLFQIAHQAKSN